MNLIRTVTQQGVGAVTGFRSLFTSASSLSSASAPPSPPPGFVEVREYTIKPEYYADYLALCKEYINVRKAHLPLLGMFTCEMGGVLHRIVHMYHYKDLDERETKRGAIAALPAWQEFLKKGRPMVERQENRILAEAVSVYQALGQGPAADFKPNTEAGQPAAGQPKRKAVYELRTYQLHAGYGSVPKLVDAFTKGLPSKVASDPEGGQLALLGSTDVGTLNQVVELWRYPSAQACIRARQASRGVPLWRETIASVTPGVQTFNTAFMHATPFSPWQ